MGFDNECILNIHSLAREYFCPVCRSLVYPSEALQTLCTHLYCKSCLTYIARTTLACPYDGYRVTESDSKPLLQTNKALADSIDKIQVRCLYYRTGCTWQGSLSDCASHSSTCTFGETLMQCNRCGIQIVHRRVQAHSQNCPGVPSQALQPSGFLGVAIAANGTALAQTQTAAPSQAQTSAPPVSAVGVVTDPHVNTHAQQQAAQTYMPTPQQWYQQQQHGQSQEQLHQYPYVSAFQQYPKQTFEVCPPQAGGQAQPQIYRQHHILQPQVLPQPQGQSQPQPQAQAQPQSRPHEQSAVNIQPSVQPVKQAQTQLQVHSEAAPSQALPYTQSQSYAQAQPVCLQQMSVPQHQQACPQLQRPFPHPYPQFQIQCYPHPQSQAQVQVQSQHYPQPPAQVPANPPPEPNQPMNLNNQPQYYNAVTGHQSHTRPQLHPQAEVGAAYLMQAFDTQQQPWYAGQMQGQLLTQAPQVRPPQSRGGAPNQQQSVKLSAQPQAPSMTPSQQPTFPFQQSSGVQGFHQVMKQQSFSGQGPCVQQPATVQAHLHAQGQYLSQEPQQIYGLPLGTQSRTAQHCSGQQIVSQGADSQPFISATGVANGSLVSSMRMNQIHPMETNIMQLPGSSGRKDTGFQENLNPAAIKKFDNQMLEKSEKDQNNCNKMANIMSSCAQFEANEMKVVKSGKSLDESVVGDDNKMTVTFPSASEVVAEPKIVERGVQEGKPMIKENTPEGLKVPLAGGDNVNQLHKDVSSNVEVLNWKHEGKCAIGACSSASMLPQSHLAYQIHSSNSPGRNQPQLMNHRPFAPQKPDNLEQPALLGHHLNHVRPEQAPPGPLLNAADNFLTSIPRHPIVSMPHQNPYDGNVARGYFEGFHDDKRRKNNCGYRSNFSRRTPAPRFNRSHKDGCLPSSPGSFGRSIRDDKFPVSQNSSNRVELDVSGRLHLDNQLQGGNYNNPQILHLEQGKEPLDNPRKRKPGSIMCHICEVECETVEGLDMHSQSREHQRKAMDLTLSIKNQNEKKHRASMIQF